MFNTLENKSSSWIKLIGLTYLYFPYFDLIEVSRLVVGGSTVKKNIYKSLRCLPDLAINRINRYNILCSKPIDLLTEQIASASLRRAENRNERLEGKRTKGRGGTICREQGDLVIFIPTRRYYRG